MHLFILSLPVVLMTRVTHQVELDRRRTPVLLQVYLTTGLFVIVSWISFIVPPEVVPGNY